MTEHHPVARWIEHHARAVPHRLAVYDRFGSHLSYLDLDLRANRVANAMAGLGIRQGDRIALWLDDSLANVEIYIAAAKIGAVLVPVNARLQSTEADYIFGECDPRMVVYANKVGERMVRCQESGSTDGRILWSTGALHTADTRDYYADTEAASDARPGGYEHAIDDTYIIAFSSGTTGRPKGAITTARGVAETVVLSAFARRLNFFDTALITTSMSFPATISASIITNLYMGNSLCIMGQGWDVEELISIAERDRASFVSIPSPYLLDFTAAAAARPEALSSLRSVLHSASKVPSRDLAALHEIVGSRLIEVWGMVETGAPVTATTVSDYLSMKESSRDLFDTVGRSLPQCVVDVVDTDGNPLPHDGTTIGELITSSPSLMAGYWNNPEATAKALRNGFYHSGDLGKIDAEGFVSIVDRRHDLIVSGGANVYPSEVERVLVDCPGVRRAIVVGIPHSRWGKTAVAAVVPEPGANLDSESVIAFVKDRLASYKKPTQVKFLEEFPVNNSGKVQRDKIAELFTN